LQQVPKPFNPSWPLALPALLHGQPRDCYLCSPGSLNLLTMTAASSHLSCYFY